MPYIPPAHGFGSKEDPIVEQTHQSAVKNLELYGEKPLSFQEYYNYKGYNGNPYDIWHKIDNVFSGNVSSAEQAYQNYLAEYEYKKNAKATASANKETYAREDSQIQRLMQDYARAGLNPYVILSGGNLSSGVVSSQAQRPDYKRSSKRELERSKSGSVLSTALKLLAILAIKG